MAVHDFDSDFRFAFNGDRVFHAASTIKVAILLAVMKAVDDGRFRLNDPLSVRNRFLSVVDGSPYLLLAGNRESSAVGIRPRGSRIEVTTDFTPDAPLMLATCALVNGII